MPWVAAPAQPRMIIGYDRHACASRRRDVPLVLAKMFHNSLDGLPNLERQPSTKKKALESATVPVLMYVHSNNIEMCLFENCNAAVLPKCLRSRSGLLVPGTLSSSNSRSKGSVPDSHFSKHSPFRHELQQVSDFNCSSGSLRSFIYIRKTGHPNKSPFSRGVHDSILFWSFPHGNWRKLLSFFEELVETFFTSFSGVALAFRLFSTFQIMTGQSTIKG